MSQLHYIVLVLVWDQILSGSKITFGVKFQYMEPDPVWVNWYRFMWYVPTYGTKMVLTNVITLGVFCPKSKKACKDGRSYLERSFPKARRQLNL